MDRLWLVSGYLVLLRSQPCPCSQELPSLLVLLTINSRMSLPGHLAVLLRGLEQEGVEMLTV